MGGFFLFVQPYRVSLLRNLISKNAFYPFKKIVPDILMFWNSSFSENLHSLHKFCTGSHFLTGV